MLSEVFVYIIEPDPSYRFLREILTNASLLVDNPFEFSDKSK